MQDICSRIKQKFSLFQQKYATILKGKKNKRKRKKERPDCCSSGPLCCKNDTDTPFNTPIFFVCILAKSNTSSKTTLSKTGDPAL